MAMAALPGRGLEIGRSGPPSGGRLNRVRSPYTLTFRRSGSRYPPPAAGPL